MKTKRGESVDYILYDGIKFYKEHKSGYYINPFKERLHVYVWEKYNGEIPKGYQIHHINGNKDDNSIENLQMLSSFEHHHGHGIRRDKDKLRAYMDNARVYASEWHKSEAGREWHKEQWESTLGKEFEKFVEKKCECCGKTYTVTSVCASRSRFCSINCKAQYRRNSKVDNVDVVCPQCGKTFSTNKYARRIFCSDECYLAFKRSNNNIVVAS